MPRNTDPKRTRLMMENARKAADIITDPLKTYKRKPKGGTGRKGPIPMPNKIKPRTSAGPKAMPNRIKPRTGPGPKAMPSGPGRTAKPANPDPSMTTPFNVQPQKPKKNGGRKQGGGIMVMPYKPKAGKPKIVTGPYKPKAGKPSIKTMPLMKPKKKVTKKVY